MLSRHPGTAAPVRVAVIFLNVGGYHAARLRAAQSAAHDRGWSLNAIQVTDSQGSHPWGDLEKEITFPLKTLMPGTTTAVELGIGAYSTQASLRLKSYLSELRPAALLVPGWGCPVSRAALQWCRRSRVPAVLMSESKQDDRARRWWKEWVKSRLYIRPAQAALVGGEIHREYVVKLGLPQERVFLGYDAVDNEHFARGAEVARRDPDAARARHPAIPRRPYFLSLTRFLPRKNVAGLVRAYGTYRERVGEDQAWDLVVCGHGEEEPAIRSTLDSLGLAPFVHLPGFVPYVALGDWYGLAAAFVHPALEEPWGLVVNEACAAGLPVLCSRTVGSRHELVHDGRNGSLFDPADIADITRSLLWAGQLAPEARIAAGLASQEIAATYGPDRFANGFLAAVDAAMQRAA
jgi:1,2-diacylglycerol 3-alpha-glucosyltransferase